MPTEPSRIVRDVDPRPADGERSAVVGFSGQYALAARAVLAKITTLEWIRLADPEAGVADDFQFHAGGTRYALQVKWAQYPGTFSWVELVKASKDAAPLIMRLAQAWQRIRNDWPGPIEIGLWSNENAATSSPKQGSDLASCSARPPRHFAAFLARSWGPVRERLRDGRGGWSRVATLTEVTDWQPAWNALRAATGLEFDVFAAFVGDFAVHFGPAVDDQLLRPDEAPRHRDLEHLAATLQALVADPSRPVQLSREALLDRLGWTNRVRFRNPHTFPVPAVYTANEAARKQLQARLDELRGGYLALVGPAGSGKSTLLASLALPQMRMVRYYAFVPDASDPLSSRGEADSFLHDVSILLEGAGLRRCRFGNDPQSQRQVLCEQLTAAAEQWQDNGEATVIVVDGLDHIPREQCPRRSLLEELPLKLPDGVFCVLGTQTTGILPRAIEEFLAYEGRTVKLPPLAPGEVLELADAAGPGGWLLPGQRERLVQVSQGHPLALTYLLQELTALEAAEPDPGLRDRTVNGLLRDASGYGKEVAARYRGYLLAIGDDRELLDVVAAVARLRTPVNLDWLKTWVTPPVFEKFVQRTRTFFRCEGRVWRFIHNSFRQFLVDETGLVAGTFDVERDRALHLKLADICGGSDARWALYRDEELAHRYLAGDYGQVIELATPSSLRDKILSLRPIAVVRDQARLALRAAAATGDHGCLLRMLLFHNELYQREAVVSPERLAALMVDIGPPERSLEHVVAAGYLRVPVDAALDAAAGFARSGFFESAAQILRAAGSLAEIIADEPKNAADWAEATYLISGLDEVLAQLDDQLVPQTPSPAPGDPSPTKDDEAKLASERLIRERQDRTAQARNRLLARCFDLLTETRDEAGLATLQGRIDLEASCGWRARARVVHAIAAGEDGDAETVLRLCQEIVKLHTSQVGDEDDEDWPPTYRTGGVPLNLRLAAANALLASGLADAPEVDMLVPPDTVAAWPSTPSSKDGFAPFETYVDLVRLRLLRDAPDSTPLQAEPLSLPQRRNAGTERFRRALTCLAQMEARRYAADIGCGIAPDVAAEADPIIRLLEVPSLETRGWTGGWYYVQAAAPGMFRRLARLSAAGGPDAVGALLDRFVAAWDDPHRSNYWPPQQRLHVLRAILPVATAALIERVSDHLDRLDTAISELAAGPSELPEVWLEQARVWREAGNIPNSERAVCAALRTAWGPGSYEDDRQLAGWLGWLEDAAAADELEREELVDTARSYAGRLASAHDVGADGSDAAAKLIQIIWPIDPALSTKLAESLCEIGVIEEGDVVEAVLEGAARDPQVPVELAAVAGAELLIPLRRQPPEQLRRTIAQRMSPQAIAVLDNAIAVWSVPNDPSDSPNSDADHFDDSFAAAASTPRGDVAPKSASLSITALLTEMRRTPYPSAEPREWSRAVDEVAGVSATMAQAKELLVQARRLRLDGEDLGGIAAIAARAGLAEEAARALADALARTSAYGWLHSYDGGSRLIVFQAALRHRDPTLSRLAATDLAGALSTGAISGPIMPEDLRRIFGTIAGEEAVAAAWTEEVAEYLNGYAPADREVLGPDESVTAARTPVEALLRWATGYLGHPSRRRDFGARRILHAGIAMAADDAETVLVESISSGGWQREAALHTLVTCEAPCSDQSSALAASIASSVVADDSICRDLARKLCERYDLAVPTPPSRTLVGTYRLTLPSLPYERTATERHVRGVPTIDMHDPQQILAPFDVPLRNAAIAAEISEEAVLHRAASIAVKLDMPWLRGGHQALAARLKTRGQLGGTRPWALMAGRRALGIVLAELVDGGALKSGFTSFPSYGLDLIDEVLVHVVPRPLDDTTPAPWLAPEYAIYKAEDWCNQTEDAAEAYAAAMAKSSTYVLAESTAWVWLDYGEQHDEKRTILTSHGTADVGPLILPPQQPWERCQSSANGYPGLRYLEWADEQLVVASWQPHSDSPYQWWLALHPEIGRILDWIPDTTELFRWLGNDGTWRARSVCRARGQLGYRRLSRSYCAEGWQVVLSDSGLADLGRAFGPLRRELVVQRTLPARSLDEDRPAAEARTSRKLLKEPG